MTKVPRLKLGALIDDKPVKITVELPSSVHRNLISNAECFSSPKRPIDWRFTELIAPMVARFLATDTALSRNRENRASWECPLIDTRSTPPYGLDSWRLAGSGKISFGGFLFGQNARSRVLDFRPYKVILPDSTATRRGSVALRGRRYQALQPRLSRGEPGQAGPVGVAVALRDALDEMIPHQARDRHRDRQRVGCGERQPHVLQPEEHLEAIRGLCRRR
jgi:hypothetical protein